MSGRDPGTTRWHHPACLDDPDLLKQCEISTGRSGGPGGQHRNKVETLVRLRHIATAIEAHAGERRSQIENKRVALRRLRLALAVDARAAVPVGEIGSALWRSRVRPRPGGGIIACNPDHHDYPALLAEAMDVLAAAGWDIAKAALRLAVTPSQLLKFIKDHPPALLRLNAERTARGMHGLR